MNKQPETSEWAWNDATLDLAETAECVCGHPTIDHAWHGCDDCHCKRSAVHALLASGWLAAERDRAVADALVRVHALAIEWAPADWVPRTSSGAALARCAAALRAVLPTEETPS